MSQTIAAIKSSIDASSSKRRITRFGYIRDTTTLNSEITPKLDGLANTHQNPGPVLNRGYYARVCAIDYAVAKFLSENTDHASLNIVEVGAGCSTLCERIHSNELEINDEKSYKVNNLHFFRVDYEAVVFKRHPKFAENLSLDLNTCGSVDFIHYLSQQTSTFNKNTKTLFVFECVLMYLSPGIPEAIMKSINSSVKYYSLAIYDPIVKPFENTQKKDHFSDVMIRNLESAGISRTTLLKYEKLGSFDTLLPRGCVKVFFGDMLEFWNSSIVGVKHRAKCNSVEMLDEVEEFDLIMKHYAFLFLLSPPPPPFADLI